MRIWFRVLCVLLIARDRVGGSRLTYFLRKDGQRLLPVCVAEEKYKYEGIGWTYSLIGNESLPKEGEDH